MSRFGSWWRKNKGWLVESELPSTGLIGRMVVYIGDDPDIAWDDPFDVVKHGEIGICLEHEFSKNVANYSSLSVLFGDRVVKVCEGEIKIIDDIFDANV